MKTWGALAQFENPAQVYHACEIVRDAGFKEWDAHTPFPVHGLEHAMGMQWSKVPWIALVCGLSGAAVAFFGQWWVSQVGYAMIIAGKPLFSWPAFVPVTFEVGVLSTAIGTLLGMLAINGLPRLNHPLFNSEAFVKHASDDKFFIAIESRDPQFDADQTLAFLRDECGASHVELVEED